MAINKVSFIATWTPPIAALNPQNRPLSQKVYDFIKSFVFFIPNAILEPLVRLPILPSSSMLFKTIIWAVRLATSKDFYKFDLEKQSIIKDHGYSVNELEIATPDHHKLKGHFLKHPKHDTNPNARVVMLFHGNGDFYQSDSALWLRELLAKDTDTPYSFVLFNPRGIGNSKGYASEKSLLIDSESMYQFASQKLGISDDRLDLYGHSLGGGEACNLKKLHPHTGGRLFLDRTFSSLDTMISKVFYNSYAWIRNGARKLVKHYGWEFDNYKALTSIQDKVYMFNHVQDRVIPTYCTIAYAIDTAVKNKTLVADNFHIVRFYSAGLRNPHMDPLVGHQDNHHEEAVFKCFKGPTSTQEAAV